MTNTLHRFSEHYAHEPPEQARPVTDDYVVFAMASQGINDDDLAGKYRAFLRLALEHGPVNVGDATRGGWLRPRPDLNPLAHWRREHRPDPEAVLAGIEGPTTVAAVFDDYQKLRGFVEALARADLGVSVNVSAPMDAAERCCREVGLPRHSVEYSLGFRGRVDRLPEAQTLELSTMCGHGMVSSALARKMLEWVKEGRRAPPEAACYLARFCSCGVFNTARAERLLEAARSGTRRPSPATERSRR